MAAGDGENARRYTARFRLGFRSPRTNERAWHFLFHRVKHGFNSVASGKDRPRWNFFPPLHPLLDPRRRNFFSPERRERLSLAWKSREGLQFREILVFRIVPSLLAVLSSPSQDKRRELGSPSCCTNDSGA